jgi:hypothetical protein
MAYTDQPLYRAAALEPIAGLNDVMFVIDQGGPIDKYSPFFAVTGVEPVIGLGPHGLFLIWTQSGAAPAGYSPLPIGAPSGTIAIAGTAKFVNPQALQQGPQQLLQMRFVLRPGPVALVGGVVDDVDLQVSSPGSLGRFGVVNQSPGVFNMAEQIQQPADAVVEPAQGANLALPAAFPQELPRDKANLSELFIFENNGPTFTLVNNAAAALTAGAIGLRIWGYRYDLVPLEEGDDRTGSWEPRFLAGRFRKAPRVPRIVTVQTAPNSGQSTF